MKDFDEYKDGSIAYWKGCCSDLFDTPLNPKAYIRQLVLEGWELMTPADEWKITYAVCLLMKERL